MDEKILKILACPQCKGKLQYGKSEEKLVCEKCQLKFKVEDNIPILLIEKAEKLQMD
jgi:uncharacterized protein YbaR (Trm112 family)